MVSLIAKANTNCDKNLPVVATVPIKASSMPNFLTITPRTKNVPVKEYSKKNINNSLYYKIFFFKNKFINSISRLHSPTRLTHIDVVENTLYCTSFQLNLTLVNKYATPLSPVNYESNKLKTWIFFHIQTEKLKIFGYNNNGKYLMQTTKKKNHCKFAQNLKCIHYCHTGP